MTGQFNIEKPLNSVERFEKIRIKTKNTKISPSNIQMELDLIAQLKGSIDSTECLVEEQIAN